MAPDCFGGYSRTRDPRRYEKRICCKKSLPFWCDLYETFLQSSKFLSACPISGGLQPTFFARSDCLFNKQLFYEYQNEQQHN